MAETQPRPEDLGKVDVLLVDDQPGNLLALEAMLGELGENLVRANSGVEALRQVLAHDFAVILMDVRMPEMDGFETATLIHERPASRDIPIIFMTAYHSTEREILRGYSVGAVDYLLKPFEPNILRNKVALFVELKRKSVLIRKQSEEILRRETEARQLAEARLRVQEQAMAEHRRFEAELAQARDEALESTHAKSQFLANMSHEIRTPLNAVLGLAGLMRDTPLNAEQSETMHDIEKSGEALLSVINDILDFSKMSAGRLLFEENDFLLDTMVEDTTDLIAESARTKNIELITELEAEVPLRLRGDPGRLRQILLNLLSNAVKFTDKGEISVRIARISESSDEATLRFEIRDTGIGIAREAQKDLFNPFYQVDATSRRRYGGTGLGLAIAAQLVQRMGGEIGVLSTPGGGSTFWFTARLKKQVGERATPPPRMLAGVSALVVDDNPTSREVIQRMLINFGMRADVADNAVRGMEALRSRAERDPYRVAILDLEMPGASGLELARWIRNEPRLTSTIVVIASSAGHRLAQQQLTQAVGIGAFLPKPLKKSKLLTVLVQLLSGERTPASSTMAGPEPSTPHAFPAETGQEVAEASGRSGPRRLQPAPIAAVQHGTPKILIAEDNPINLKLALRQVSKLGYPADGAGNGREALAAIEKIHYDAILMDCQMPEMDGYEATQAIRSREQESGGHIPVIALTAHALDGDREKCLKAGMDDYISKPVNIGRLSEVLKQYLRVRPAQSPSPSHPETGIVDAKSENSEA